MKFLAILVIAIPLLAQEATPIASISPLDIVNERNRALNAHDLDAFLATYADDVSIYVYPAEKIGNGKKHIQKIFSLFIEEKRVSTTVLSTMEADGYVVVESSTTFGEKTEAGIAIYEVRDEKIQSVRFLRDSLRAKQTEAEDGH